MEGRFHTGGGPCPPMAMQARLCSAARAVFSIMSRWGIRGLNFLASRFVHGGSRLQSTLCYLITRGQNSKLARHLILLNTVPSGSRVSNNFRAIVPRNCQTEPKLVPQNGAREGHSGILDTAIFRWQVISMSALRDARGRHIPRD